MDDKLICERYRFTFIIYKYVIVSKKINCLFRTSVPLRSWGQNIVRKSAPWRDNDIQGDDFGR